MKKTIVQLVILLFATLSLLAVADKNTLYVDKGNIYTAAGELLVMRGFNEMFVWSVDKTGERFIPEIDKTGANTLRLVWDKNFSPKDLIKLIDNTIAHKMVAVPECHNATGKWGKELQACVDFWNNPLLIAGIERNRQWTILNIANEAGDHNISDEKFLATYKAAITSLRNWGYTVPIMIDASLWGQNVDQLLRVGPALLKHDPLSNIIFSTHSYWTAEQSIGNYYKVAKKAKDLGIAMIVGEGPSVTRVGQCDNPTPLPYLEGMKILEEYQVGWLNWSWGGMKNGDCDNFRYFDITKQGYFGHWLHQHGANIVVLSPYGVMQTSDRPQSFYEDAIVQTSGIYLHLEKNQVSVGEKILFDVVVAPANAANKNFTLSIAGNKDVIQLNEKENQITALKKGKSRITARTQDQDSGIMWVVDLEVK
jgi:mannan endo-1,4-beta-mannosidase